MKINNILKSTLFGLVFISLTSNSYAETTISEEGQYIFNTLGFYIGGVLVAFMAAGFCMLESGLVTTKSVSTIGAKNIGKFAICSIVFSFLDTTWRTVFQRVDTLDHLIYGLIVLKWELVIQIVQTFSFK